MRDDAVLGRALPLDRNFMKMFDAGKTRVTGLPYGEETVTIC